MKRHSYSPYILEKTKAKRSEYTIKSNNNLEPYKHAALVVSRKGGGSIIGYGVNTYNKQYGSRHAEDMAFESARKYVSKNKGQNLSNRRHRMKVDIIVLRASGGNSRPCHHCITEQIINNNHFNVRKVIYSDNDNDNGYVTTNKNSLYEHRNEYFTRFNRNRLNYNLDILNDVNANNLCCGTNHQHDDYTDDEDNNDEDETDKNLHTFYINTND